MKRNHFLCLIFTMLFTSFIISETKGASIQFPTPKKIEFKDAIISVGGSSEFSAPSEINNRFKAAIDAFKLRLSSFPAKDNVSIKVEILKENKKPNDALNCRESYMIEISDRLIKISGSDAIGVLHGITTLEKMLLKSNGKISQGTIIDWPDHKIRALHLPVWSTRERKITTQYIKELIRIARFGNFNTLILQLGDGIKLKTMSTIAKNDAWSIEEFLDVVHYAQENGLDVIPEIKLLTHQEKLLKNTYPNLMYNKVTYDPRKEEVYNIVLPILDEVIYLIKPRVVHIGHDEVAGHGKESEEKWLAEGESMLPSDLFLKDIERLHAYAKKRGIELWMWGDMLISRDEFPQMFDKHLHGTRNYSSIRNKSPREIAICDWHYFDKQKEFPSIATFAKSGHKVLGATWKREETIKNFSRYAANLPTGAQGMIATTWFHVHRQETDLLTKIINTSAEAFWNAK